MSPTVGGGVVVDDPDHAGTEERAPRDGVLADVAWVLGSYLLLGAVGAVLWWVLVDPALFTKADNGGVSMGEVQLGRRFDTDGWYAVIAGVLGLLAGGVLTWWRCRDLLLTSMLQVVGAGLAAALMGWLGRALGPAAPKSVAASVAVGDRIPTQLEVTATVCYLVWPIAALLGALFVLWSPPTEPPANQPGDGDASLA